MCAGDFGPLASHAVVVSCSGGNLRGRCVCCCLVTIIYRNFNHSAETVCMPVPRRPVCFSLGVSRSPTLYGIGVEGISSLSPRILCLYPGTAAAGVLRRRCLPSAPVMVGRWGGMSMQEAVDAGGEAGVHLLFASPGGQEVAAVVTAGPWSSSAPAESTVGSKFSAPPRPISGAREYPCALGSVEFGLPRLIGHGTGFVSPDEAAACEHKHSIARAAAKHQGALATCLGDDRVCTTKSPTFPPVHCLHAHRIAFIRTHPLLCACQHLERSFGFVVMVQTEDNFRSIYMIDKRTAAGKCLGMGAGAAELSVLH